MHATSVEHKRCVSRSGGFQARSTVTALSTIFALALVFPPAAAPGENLKTESRSFHLHRIMLRDASDQIIPPRSHGGGEGKSQEIAANPYSSAKTCGRCHEYEIIGGGWHFNAAKSGAKAGRPGEPWILTDAVTHTQLPLSHRGWAGTFKPAEIGLSGFDFTVAFGRHLPGGGAGEPDKKQTEAGDARMRRFQVTGPMEIDCMICHELNGHYDHVARSRALANESFQWAASIATGLGMIAPGRSVKSIADLLKPDGPPPSGLPALKYERDRFDAENHVTFDVTRRPPAKNCYYCHTSNTETGDAQWHSDQDVHLRAGMTCVDCHRNNVDHQIVRGYEGETQDRQISPLMVEVRTKLIQRNDAAVSEADARKAAEQQLKDELSRTETLSCRGCHYGNDAGKDPAARLGGRMGAPEPIHKGLPPVHLEKLSCTACHSGLFPGSAPQPVQLSRAHKLGLPSPARTANTPPVIVQPVFLRGQDGKIAPHNMVWPSYWGRLKNGKVTPMLPADVLKKAKDDFPTQSSEDMTRDPYFSAPLTNPQIRDVLSTLANDTADGEPVFIAAGKLHRLVSGKVQPEEHAAAQPYAWPVGHDVRPARQALGARGCADCHSDRAPIYFSTVTPRGPVLAKNITSKEMIALRGDDRTLASLFAFTFNFRPMLKCIGFGSALIVLGVLLSCGLGGLNARLRNRKPPEDKS